MTYLLLLSPAKKQQYEHPDFKLNTSKIRLQAETAELVMQLKQMSRKQLAKILKISDALAELNTERYRVYDPNQYNADNANPAMYTFHGDVYRAFDVMTLKATDLDFLQDHIRILSGLYGMLRPLDKIQYHRLEMGCAFKNSHGAHLYDFWREEVTRLLQKDLGRDGMVVNCASNEYAKVIDRAQLKRPWVDVVFKQKRGGVMKSIGILAKRARGQMARYAVVKKCKLASDLKKFNEDGYRYHLDLSDEHQWVFVSDLV